MKGSIRNIGKNKWQLVFDVPSIALHDGKAKRSQKRLTFNGTKKEAEKKLAELVSAIESGKYVKETKMTTKQYLEYWHERHGKKVSYRTEESYRQTIENHLAPALGRVKLKDLKPSHVEDYLFENAKTFSDTTLFYHYRVLSMAMKQAVRWEMIERNPCDGVTPPTKEKYKGDRLTAKQVKLLLDTTNGLPIYIPIVLAAFAGLRRGEICALSWNDIDFEEKILWVRHSVCRYDGKLIIKETKTNKERPVAMSNFLYEELKKHKQSHENWDSAAAIERNHVCCWEDGSIFVPEYISRNFTKALKLIKIENKTRFHDLRHNFATLLLDCEINPKIVADIMGHSDVYKTTMGVYSHTDIEMQRRAVKYIENRYLN